MDGLHLAIIVLLLVIIVLLYNRKEHAVLDINGVKIRVNQDPYGIYTSGATLRDDTVFSSTDQ